VVVAKPDPQSSAVEQGVICSSGILDSFTVPTGRKKSFFTTLMGGTHPDDLQMDTESSFR
jgi:hypothetical protein